MESKSDELLARKPAVGTTKSCMGYLESVAMHPPNERVTFGLTIPGDLSIAWNASKGLVGCQVKVTIEVVEDEE